MALKIAASLNEVVRGESIEGRQDGNRGREERGIAAARSFFRSVFGAVSDRPICLLNGMDFIAKKIGRKEGKNYELRARP